MTDGPLQARPSLSLPMRERTWFRRLAKPGPLRLSPESFRGRTRGVFRREECVCEGVAARHGSLHTRGQRPCALLVLTPPFRLSSARSLANKTSPRPARRPPGHVLRNPKRLHRMHPGRSALRGAASRAALRKARKAGRGSDEAAYSGRTLSLVYRVVLHRWNVVSSMSIGGRLARRRIES